MRYIPNDNQYGNPVSNNKFSQQTYDNSKIPIPVESIQRVINFVTKNKNSEKQKSTINNNQQMPTPIPGVLKINEKSNRSINNISDNIPISNNRNEINDNNVFFEQVQQSPLQQQSRYSIGRSRSRDKLNSYSQIQQSKSAYNKQQFQNQPQQYSKIQRTMQQHHNENSRKTPDHFSRHSVSMMNNNSIGISKDNIIDYKGRDSISNASNINVNGNGLKPSPSSISRNHSTFVANQNQALQQQISAENSNNYTKGKNVSYANLKTFQVFEDNIDSFVTKYILLVN